MLSVKAGDTVIVLGCGPVGLFAQKFCWLKGAKRVIAVDYVNYRLQHAKRTNKVEIVNFEDHENTGSYLKEITKGGADVVIDAVGMDGKMTDLEFLASGLKLQGGAMSALVIASQAVRKGGTIQITGVYGGRYNGFPLAISCSGTSISDQDKLRLSIICRICLNWCQPSKIDPGDVVSHVIPLSEAKHGYEMFDTKTDDCIKVVLKP
ncbi:zinc-binding dehydrogenase [Bacillus velezensis]